MHPLRSANRYACETDPQRGLIQCSASAGLAKLVISALKKVGRTANCSLPNSSASKNEFRQRRARLDPITPGQEYIRSPVQRLDQPGFILKLPGDFLGPGQLFVIGLRRA